MTRWTVLGLAGGVLLGIAGCGRAPVAAPDAKAWVLMHPPQVRDETFPRGYRFLTRAPLSAWSSRATFASGQACEDWKQEELDRTIDRARAAWGDDAKNDLDVRRAVNARCVSQADASAAH